MLRQNDCRITIRKKFFPKVECEKSLCIGCLQCKLFNNTVPTQATGDNFEVDHKYFAEKNFAG